MVMSRVKRSGSNSQGTGYTAECTGHFAEKKLGGKGHSKSIINGLKKIRLTDNATEIHNIKQVN